MKVILNSDVENLGEEGDILDVANGYARNYLLPQGLVLEYNTRNIAKIEERREAIEQRKNDKRTEAMSVKDRLETEDLAISMTAGRNGKLFGSVSSATIADQLAARGIDVERKKIEVPDKSIKAVGNYKVKIRLYGGAEAVLTVRVEADSAAPTMAQSEESIEETVESEAVETTGEVVEESVEEEAGDDEGVAEENLEEDPIGEEPAPETPAEEAATEVAVEEDGADGEVSAEADTDEDDERSKE